MAISVFQNFGFLTPKISKNRFFGKNDPKIQNIQNFQKKNVTYLIQILVVYQCTKFQCARLAAVIGLGVSLGGAL